MLSYVLQGHDKDEKRSRPLTGKEKKIHDDLEKRSDSGFKRLFVKEGYATSVSLESAESIMSIMQEQTSNAGLFDYRIRRLRELKKRIIGHQQKSVNRLLNAYIATTSMLCTNLQAEPRAEQAFPMISTPGSEHEKDNFVQDFMLMLSNGRLDDIDRYFDAVKEFLSSSNDLVRGSQMMEGLEKYVFDWCISPVSMTSAPEDDTEQYVEGYARLMLELDELGIRLSGTNKGWKDILRKVFRDYYAEDTHQKESILKSMQQTIGSPDLLAKIPITKKMKEKKPED